MKRIERLKSTRQIEADIERKLACGFRLNKLKNTIQDSEESEDY